MLCWIVVTLSRECVSTYDLDSGKLKVVSHPDYLYKQIDVLSRYISYYDYLLWGIR